MVPFLESVEFDGRRISGQMFYSSGSDRMRHVRGAVALLIFDLITDVKFPARREICLKIAIL